MNLSGNETWQQGDPPTDVTFENVRATNCKTGFIAYGTENVPFCLELKNVEYTCHDDHQEFPLVRVAHFEEIKLENVKVSNYRNGELVKSWTDGGKVVLVNTEIDKKDVVPLIKTEEEFVIKKI